MLSKYNLKAVVFDDVKEEADPLIDALNDERIPNVFINFKDDQRDDRKLKNIRIVFSDLIIGEYHPGDDNNTVEAIRASILDNIDEHNGPFILAVWSKHNTLAETLKNRLLEFNPKLNFILVKLDKNDYFEKNATTNKWVLQAGKIFQNIKNDINSQINSLKHLPIFLEWEQDVRSTISRLLNEFIPDISDEKKVENTISSTIKSTLGKQIEASLEDKIKSFYQTMNITLADSIEHHSVPTEEHKEFLDDLDLENIDDETKAEINKKTLFEDPVDNALKTGNIYSFNDFKNKFSDDTLNEVCGYDYEKILESDLFRYTKKCKFFEKETNETDVDHQKRHYEKMKDNSYPVLLEFTPSCDIANSKYKKSRLIFGYMINSKYSCLENESESLYITKFHFKHKNEHGSLDGNYRLAFFIKNIIAVNPEKIKGLTPIIRARKEFATDLQHAIANHISRIGISSMDL